MEDTMEYWMFALVLLRVLVPVVVTIWLADRVKAWDLRRSNA
jgi:hypothetical protein